MPERYGLEGVTGGGGFLHYWEKPAEREWGHPTEGRGAPRWDHSRAGGLFCKSHQPLQIRLQALPSLCASGKAGMTTPIGGILVTLLTGLSGGACGCPGKSPSAFSKVTSR